MWLDWIKYEILSGIKIMIKFKIIELLYYPLY